MALPKDGFAALQQELTSERAGALGRMGDTIERLLAQLVSLTESLPSLKPEERARAVEQHEQIRLEAEKYVWYLIVTREAAGLRRHDVVYEMYPVPKKLK